MLEFIDRLGREGCWHVEIYWGGKDAGIYRQTGERGVLECRNKNILGRLSCCFTSTEAG